MRFGAFHDDTDDEFDEAAAAEAVAEPVADAAAEAEAKAAPEAEAEAEAASGAPTAPTPACQTQNMHNAFQDTKGSDVLDKWRRSSGIIPN